ncbi:cell division protein FtsA [Rubricella aquisinus]|uniref:Cell division protein FtsA n=1 Tax=Rubricella aquisinus TaxID=2028108 RepID=A0A840X2H0_9RHOB|nr:cell division protein FtsA [Rubricella aquisinus]MBB5516065.1 cell division protein FtsA [Rubricella aquisinus]
MTRIALYKSQRAMRERREAALRRGNVAIVDVGSSKMTCLVLEVDAAKLRAPRADGVGRLDGHAALRVIGASTTQSRGIDLGEVVSMEEVERGLRTVVSAAQKMAETRVDHVIACFSGGRPRSYGLLGEAEVEHGEVSASDIGAALGSCDVPDYGEGREVLHALPVNFTLDSRTGLSDPRGLTGAKLTVDMHMMTVARAPVQNLLQCMRRCDLELSGLAHSAYAAGLSSLTEEELDLGAACIDIGGGTTGISVFIRKQLIYADSVRMGGAHVTRDISQGFGVSAGLAERLKTVHGGLVATSMDDLEMLSLVASDPHTDPSRNRISRTELIGIMRPRVEEILEAVRERLDAASFSDLPGRRIVLTGGSSQIPGLEDIAQHILGRRVRIGRPLYIPGLPQAKTAPQFAAAVGLALHLVKPQDECWDFEMPDDRIGGQRIRRALRWFKESW